MPARSLCVAVAACMLFVGEPAHAAQQYQSEKGPLKVTEVAGDLDHPWALAFLPGAGYLVTERSGKLLHISADGKQSSPIGGVPEVWAHEQGGLMDIALSPDFEADRMLYLSYSEADASGKKGSTAVGRGTLSQDMTRLENFQVIFRQQPQLSDGKHFGSRLVFDGDGYLFIALGENNQRATSQDLDKLQGKVVRIYPDGKIPPDNPFVNQPGKRPEIWSYGHRNQQGAAMNPWTGALWTNEHGPRGGDEINIVERGGNYGWPLATQGINYSGQPIPEAKGKTMPDGIDPFYVWAKSPAISGMAFYDSDTFTPWRHNLFIGALADQDLIRLELKDGKVVHEERLLKELNARVRDVRVGPDGYVYVLTDERDGQLLKLGL